MLADFACGEGLDDFSIVLEVEHLLDLLVRKFGKVFPKRLLKAPCLHGELQRRLAQRDKQDTHDWRSGGHDKARVIKRGGKGATAAMEARAAQMDNDWRAPPIPGARTSKIGVSHSPAAATKNKNRLIGSAQRRIKALKLDTRAKT